MAIVTLALSALAVFAPLRAAMALPLAPSAITSDLTAATGSPAEMLMVRQSGSPIFLPPGHGYGHFNGMNQRSYSGPHNRPSFNGYNRAVGHSNRMYQHSYSGSHNRSYYTRSNRSYGHYDRTYRRSHYSDISRRHYDRTYRRSHAGHYSGSYNHRYSRHYYGHRYRHRHHGYNYFYGGFWYANPWWLYDSYESYNGGGHVQWCLNRYRSYDPGTDTYLGYDGLRHYCRSPYD